MTELVERYPQLLGIGIDEGTAIVVSESQAEVVHQLYDRKQAMSSEGTDYLQLTSGDNYDLATRQIIDQRR